MILFIVFVVVTAFILIATHFGEGLCPEAFVMAPLLGAVASILYTLVVVLCSMASPTTVMVEKDLVALQDGSSVSGSFFLGIGSIGEDATFSYYAKDRNGYRLESMDADKVTVKYSDNPRVVYECYQETTMRPPWVPWTEEVRCHDANATFYVPEGSIKQDYILDAK